MNDITVSLNDRTKKAVCRETVSLCAQYTLKVEPALKGDGFLVLHRRHIGSGAPDGKTVFVGGEIAANPVYEWDMNEVYAVVNLSTSEDVQGKSVTTGTLDLRHMNLCRDLIQRFGTGTEVPVVFAVYDPLAGGMVGDGEFNVKVVEPYYISPDQSLALFKGPPGDKGVGIVDIRVTGTTPSGETLCTVTFDGNVTSDESEEEAGGEGSDDVGKTSYTFAIPKGEAGVGIVGVEYAGETEDGGGRYVISFTDGTSAEFVAPRGLQGEPGPRGLRGLPGPQGEQGAPRQASATDPLMDGDADAGTSDEYARGDHRHPTDTSRASKEELGNKMDKLSTPCPSDFFPITKTDGTLKRSSYTPSSFAQSWHEHYSYSIMHYNAATGAYDSMDYVLDDLAVRVEALEAAVGGGNDVGVTLGTVHHNGMSATAYPGTVGGGDYSSWLVPADCMTCLMVRADRVLDPACGDFSMGGDLKSDFYGVVAGVKYEDPYNCTTARFALPLYDVATCYGNASTIGDKTDFDYWREGSPSTDIRGRLVQDAEGTWWLCCTPRIQCFCESPMPTTYGDDDPYAIATAIKSTYSSSCFDFEAQMSAFLKYADCGCDEGMTVADGYTTVVISEYPAI